MGEDLVTHCFVYATWSHTHLCWWYPPVGCFYPSTRSWTDFGTDGTDTDVDGFRVPSFPDSRPGMLEILDDLPLFLVFLVGGWVFPPHRVGLPMSLTDSTRDGIVAGTLATAFVKSLVLVAVAADADDSAVADAAAAVHKGTWTVMMTWDDAAGSGGFVVVVDDIAVCG